MSGSHESQGRDPLDDVRAALASGEPLALLEMVGTLMTALDPRSGDPFGRDSEPRPSLAELVDTFIGVPAPETTALLAVIAELSDDEVQGARIRREISSRGDRLPDWLERLGEASVERVMDMTTELGDGDNVLLGLRLVTGERMSAVVYIDHNMGTLVKDAFLIPTSIDDLETRMRTLSEPDETGGERTDFSDLDPAVARARITDAIETAAMTVPPLESESWPAVRPVVEWAVGMLPAGGAGYQRREWSEDDLQEITVDFLQSPYGRNHHSTDHVNLLQLIVQYAADRSTADPYRWSGTAVEILLLGWLPNKVMAEAEFLSQVPEVLRSYIAYCHAHQGIAKTVTQRTLFTLDRIEPEFKRMILDDDSGLPQELLEAVLGGDASLLRQYDTVNEQRVGGERALAELDDEPLPDEDFDWTGIPDDIRDRVGEVLTLADRCCDELFDQECRTAARRLLARAATGDPEFFRRRGRSDTAAAALCSAIGKANGLVAGPGAMTAKALEQYFGVYGISSRVRTLLRAAGIERSYDGALGSPDLLTAEQRRGIIQQRDA